MQDSCICGQDYTAMSRARCCVLNVKYSNVDQVKRSQLYCVLHRDRIRSTDGVYTTGGVYTGFHASQIQDLTRQDLTRLPPRDSTLNGRWTRKPFGLSRVQPIYLSIPRPS